MARDKSSGSSAADLNAGPSPSQGREQFTVDRPRDDYARDKFGGINWGAAFFGWLAANGLSVILVALLAAAGAAVGLTKINPDQASQQAKSNAETIGLGGAIGLLVILALAYYAGGYVAGRMSRFDGARQGVAVWVIGLLVVILLAILGAVFGAKYNVLAQLNLPRIPIDEGTLGLSGVIALAAVLILTFLASMLGGKAGTHYHRRVDRAKSGGFTS